jgi:predicted DNA-binding WGR domain protein
MPRYTFSEGTSNKFWQIDLNGSSFTTTFGRIGASGQSSTKAFPSDSKALSEYNRLIAEKTKKGYQLENVAVSTGTPTLRATQPSAPKTAELSVPDTSGPPTIEPAPESAPSVTRSAPASAPSIDMNAAAQAAKAELAQFAIEPLHVKRREALPAPRPLPRAEPVAEPLEQALCKQMVSLAQLKKSFEPNEVAEQAGLAPIAPARLVGLVDKLFMGGALDAFGYKRLVRAEGYLYNPYGGDPSSTSPEAAPLPVPALATIIKSARSQLSFNSGDAETLNLGRAIVSEYGSLETPEKLDLDLAAKLLQIVAGNEPNARTELVMFWVAHNGLAFALEAFALAAQSSLTSQHDHKHGNFNCLHLEHAENRTFEDRLAERTDRVLHAIWLGASEDERLAARRHAEQLRKAGSLLCRSALASCLLIEEWIDADLREFAETGAPALFTPEGLLRANAPPDITNWFNKVGTQRTHLFSADGWHDEKPLIGNVFVAKFGLAGIDIAIARLKTALSTFEADAYGHFEFPAVRELLTVVGLAREYPPATVDASFAVLNALGDAKLSKNEDPRPAAYEVLRASPRLAIPLVRAQARRGWAKTLLLQLERLVGEDADDQRAEAAASSLPQALRSSAKFKSPDFWQPATLPRIVFTDGTVLPRAHLQALAAALKADDRGAIAELKRVAEPASLSNFGWELFQSWLTQGGQSKEKWAFVALGLLGDDEAARRLTPLIRAWPGESQHQRAVTGLDVLGDIGTDVALMMLNGIAQKVKFKGLQERARERMEAIANKRGFTAEQLADRLVPDLDLEDDGSKTLDFGPRSFRVGFDETLSPFVMDATGARLKDLPKPNSKDDAALAQQATDAWKAMKKDVRALASIQLLRLELAMANARRWSAEEFRSFFVEHPLLTHVVRRLVWGVYGPDGNLQRSFRVAEDRTYADAADDACELPSRAVLGIAHRLHLTDADVSAWSKVLSEYELVQPFEQLVRSIHRLSPDEREGTNLQRFDKRVVETRKMLGLLSRGWRKGPAQDGGCIFEMYKPIRPGLIASLDFEQGLNAGGMDSVDPTQMLHALTFAPDEPNWGTRQGLMELTQVDDVTLSEVIRDVESLGAQA